MERKAADPRSPRTGSTDPPYFPFIQVTDGKNGAPDGPPQLLLLANHSLHLQLEIEEMSQRIRPRDAASMVLLNSDQNTQSVVMGRRPSSSRFMPEVFVFPGGKLDPEDLLIQTPYPLKAETAQAMRGATSDRAQLAGGLANAAIRETYEETSLLVAKPAAHTSPVSGTWQTFSALGMAPNQSALRLLARAITPTMSPVRYHARFFAATSESVTGKLESSEELQDLAWYPIEEALQLPIIDVTRMVLEHAQSCLESDALESQPPVTLFIHYRGEHPIIKREMVK